jgi:thioredoxin reductase (NADPH)
MAMSVGKDDSDEGSISDINTTPLVDVMLVLLIIFLITVPVIKKMAAVEEALYLTNHSHDVTLIHRRDSLRAEKILQDRLFANPHIKIVWDSEVVEFVAGGEPEALIGLDIKNRLTGEVSRIDVEGAFVAIGHKPATELFDGQLKLDSDGYLEVETGTTKTSIPGVFACGDVMDKIYRQAVTAAGTGCMAALDAEKYLAAQEFEALAAE